MAKTTGKQKAFLEGFGVNVPPTKGAAKALISYILEGTSAGHGPKGRDNEAVQKRAAIVRSVQKQWVGRRVTVARSEHVRRVVRILAKTP